MNSTEFTEYMEEISQQQDNNKPLILVVGASRTGKRSLINFVLNKI